MVVHVFKFIDVLQARSFTATVISSESIELTWNSAISSFVESYEVFYNDPNTNILITSGTIGADQLNYTFTNLDANVTYEFSILAYNDLSNSSAVTVTAIGMYILLFLIMPLILLIKLSFCHS